MKAPIFLLGILCIALSPAFQFAEGATGTRVRISTSYESWDQELADLDEVTTYVAASVPIGREMKLDMLAGHAQADGGELGDAGGLLNSRVRLSYSPGSHWAFRVGLDAPTGVTDLSDEEMEVARVLSDRLRGYRGAKLGEGFGVDLGAAYSFLLGPATVGIGAGYRFRGEYDVSESLAGYDPGDQATFSLGFDLGNPRWLWRVDGIHIRYADDKVDGQETFRIGPRFEIRSSLTYRGDRTVGRLSLQTIQIGKDQIPGPDGLETEDRNSNPGEYYLQAGFSRMLTRSVSLLLFGGGRLFKEADDGKGGARRSDVGVGTSLRLSRSVTALVRGGYSKASLDLESGEVDLEGLLATLALEARL
jgi:hypothetical protein